MVGLNDETYVDLIHEAFYSSIEEDANGDKGAGLTDGLFAIARGLESCSRAISNLGNGNAATQMGAIEAFSVVFQESMQILASAISQEKRHG